MRKAIDELKEFMDAVLADYSLQYDYEIDGKPVGTFHATVKVWQHHVRSAKSLRFRYFLHQLELEVYEDYWEKVDPSNYRVRYFWIALLDWPDF